MPEQNINSDLIRGHIDTIILKILRDGDNYGYEIMKAVSMNSNNEKQGHIVSYWGDQSQGGRRKYYHITDSGNAAYEKALSEWLHAKNIITMLLQGGKDE